MNKLLSALLFAMLSAVSVTGMMACFRAAFTLDSTSFDFYGFFAGAVLLMALGIAALATALDSTLSALDSE